MTKVNVAEIDRYLLAVAGLRSKLTYVISHHNTIHTASRWMVCGSPAKAFKSRPRPPPNFGFARKYGPTRAAALSARNAVWLSSVQRK